MVRVQADDDHDRKCASEDQESERRQELSAALRTSGHGMEEIGETHYPHPKDSSPIAGLCSGKLLLSRPRLDPGGRFHFFGQLVEKLTENALPATHGGPEDGA